MLNQLLFILFGIVLDNSNFIKLPEPKYESIRIMNYCAWSSIALYSLFYEITYAQSGIFITNTIIGSYVYEIIFHTPDIGHFIHHVCTILTMCIGYASGVYSYGWFQYLSLINYVALSSSIISSVRHLHPLIPYKYKIVCFYKSYYIFSKSTAIVFHYWIFIENWKTNLTLFENLTLVIFFLVHLIQIYFIYIILRRRN
jgi:hypothetical protein